MTLTAIGIGTAFGLLLLLMVVVGVMRLMVQHVLERPSGATGTSRWSFRNSVEKSRQRQSDKALAAITAVTVLLSDRGAARRP